MLSRAALAGRRLAGSPAARSQVRTAVWMARQDSTPQCNRVQENTVGIPGVGSWKWLHPNGKQHGAVEDHEQTYYNDDWRAMPYRGMGLLWNTIFYGAFLSFFIGQSWDSASMDTHITCKVFGYWGPI